MENQEKVVLEIASLQDQLEYQSSMASLFATKLQEVWNMQDDIIDKINNISEGDCVSVEYIVKKLQEVKNIIPAECDKWDKKTSTAYLFEYVSRLKGKGFQISIEQDCTLKNYDYKLDIKQDGLLYVFDFSSISDTDDESIALWDGVNIGYDSFAELARRHKDFSISLRNNNIENAFKHVLGVDLKTNFTCMSISENDFGYFEKHKQINLVLGTSGYTVKYEPENSKLRFIFAEGGLE